MNILFIYPEHYLNIGIPGGISILSAKLKEHGHKVKVFDTVFVKVRESYAARESHKHKHGGSGETDKGGISLFKETAYTIEDLVKDDPVTTYEEEFQKTIDRFLPDIIAISSMTSTFDFALDLLRSVKYQAKVLLGGVHPTIAIDDCLAQKEIDIACFGEADSVLPELCNLMEAGKDYTGVKSMAFRLFDGSIKKNPPAPRVDLNELPCPDWGLFDKRHLFRPFDGKIYSGSFYVQSRGCPLHCTYCINSTVSEETGGMKGYFRVQKPSVTISHLREFKEKFDATWFKFADDTFLLPPVEHLEELRDGLKPIGIKFGCSVMPNTITKEKLKIAKDMGCVAMTVGIESGNKQIRKMIKRTYSDETLVRNLALIRDHDIRVSTFNIVGFPGETRENVFETIEINRAAGVSASNVYVLFPYPGTPIQKEHKIPLRDRKGEIYPPSSAKSLNLSNRGGGELEALKRTFNLYLVLPKGLWPIIKLAELDSEKGKAFECVIKRYATLLLSRAEIETEMLCNATEEKEAGIFYDIGDFNVPSVLIQLLSISNIDEEIAVIVESLKKCFGRNQKKYGR